jgi:hypothetical protein
MTSKPNAARGEQGAQQSPASAAPPEREPFVINLSSSTTPMALVQPQAPELARFTFFVSRRREDGRERFHLHMGYFENLAEAEEWLTLVREIYPGAWAGEAPGKRLRAGQRTVPQPAPRLPDASASSPARTVPVLQAAQRPAPAAPAAAVASAATSPAVAMPPAVPPAAAAPGARAGAAPVMARPQSASPAPRAHAPAAPNRAPVAASPATSAPILTAARAAPAGGMQPAPPAAKPSPAGSQLRAGTPQTGPHAPPILPKSNVREVLAALDSAREKPVPAPHAAASAKSAAGPAPARVAAAPHKAQPAPPKAQDAAKREMPALAARLAALEAVGEPASLSDTQVLTMLENRRDANAGAASVPSGTAADGEIRLLRPEDPGTMQELRKDLTQVSFAVQLDWSVQPIDLTRVPPLAIFSAYTLYTVEGNREGRKWYGLRLGFFSDSTSAKQVAYYVRSEFTSVAVVPVGAEEKKRASDDGRLSPNAIGPRRQAEAAPDEFKLLDDAALAQASAQSKPAASRTMRDPKAPALPNARPAAPPPAARKATRRKPRSGASLEDRLEETLEILGANQLTIDNGRGERINDSGVRHLEVRVDRRTFTFATLLDRLADKLGRG